MAAIRHQNESDLFYLDSDLKDTEPLSHEEEKELFDMIKQGDLEAKHRLIKANLRFVVSVVKQYKSRWNGNISELVSEGNMGLLEAIRRFDSSKGFKFITYAVWWIRQAIQKALVQQGRSGRVPISRMNDLDRLEKFIRVFIADHDREPSLGEIEELSGLSAERLTNALVLTGRDISFDAILNEEDRLTFLGVFVSEDPEPDAELVEKEDVENVRDLLDCLDERERYIIKNYFGIDTHEPKVLEDIAKTLGITRERVRQIKERGLTKIRSSIGRKDLRGGDKVDELAARLLREKHKVFRCHRDLESLREQNAIRSESDKLIKERIKIDFDDVRD